MNFVEAVKTGKPIREASWVRGLYIKWSFEKVCWVFYSSEAREWKPVGDAHAVIGYHAVTKDDWEACEEEDMEPFGGGR